MEVLLATPRGFCAGVERAISIVERALALHGAPIYVRHEVVHNRYVVEDLRSKGAVFVEELAEATPHVEGADGLHGSIIALIDPYVIAAARGIDDDGASARHEPKPRSRR